VIDFSHKVILVTGGGAGIGRATVAAFAGLGGTVMVHADGGALAAAGWYRDDRGTWTNMPVIKGNSLRPAE